jgi:hypothetical protein
MVVAIPTYPSPLPRDTYRNGATAPNRRGQRRGLTLRRPSSYFIIRCPPLVPLVCDAAGPCLIKPLASETISSPVRDHMGIAAALTRLNPQTATASASGVSSTIPEGRTIVR